MREYKIQVRKCNARRYFLEKSLHLSFPHSVQPYIIAESLITTKKRKLITLASVKPTTTST